MFRFNTKSLLYLTATVAALALMLREASQRPNWGAFVGYAMFVSLVGWKFYVQIKAENAMMSAADKQEKQGE